MKDYTMKNDTIALTDLVKLLGYKDYSKLSNPIRDILTDKEDFNKFVVDDRQYTRGKQEKFTVKIEAKILVENLILIRQFPSLFGKAPEKEPHVLTSYKDLKNGLDGDLFQQKVLKQEDLHRQKIVLSKKCLKDLPIFASAILNYGRIDITKVSLKELMAASNNNEILDTRNAYAIASWNELIELQEKVDQGEMNTTTYQLIGEKLLNLGEIDQALEALNTSVEIEPKNGISWALTAKTLYNALKRNQQEHYKIRSQIDFSDSIVNPITSEEYWINERIDETSSISSEVHGQFIEAAINALLYWPHSEYLEQNSDEKKNFFVNLNHSSETDVDLCREELFLELVIEIQHSDYLKRQKPFIEVLRSFKIWGEAYSTPMISSNKIDPDTKAKLICVINWVSTDDIALTIETLVQYWIGSPSVASSSLVLLKQPTVSQLCWRILGKGKFTDIFEKLESFDHQNKATNKLSTLAGLHLNDLLDCFQPITQKINDCFQEYISPRNFEVVKEEFELNFDHVNELETTINHSLMFIEGWHNYLDHFIWKKAPFSDALPMELLTYTMLSALIEVSNGNINKINTQVLAGFGGNKKTSMLVLGTLDSNFIDFFLQKICDDLQNQEKFRAIMQIIEKIVHFKEELDEDILEYSLCEI